MDPEAYFRDMTAEFHAVKNKLRNLIGNVHPPSDGAWKESVLRSSIRGYLPPSFTVGSGFVITPESISTQLDIMVCDGSAPMLFRDGDFIIAPADCVRAIVEVKTSISATTLGEALTKLDATSQIMRKRCVRHPPFIGVFSFDVSTTNHHSVLEILNLSNGNTPAYPIAALSLGDSQFYRFWEHHPTNRPRRQYDSWHAYALHGTAPGYFLHNLIFALFPEAVERAEHMWFPQGGKEPHFVEAMKRGQQIVA